VTNPIKALAHRAGKSYIRRVCSEESRRQQFTHHNERPIEYRFALECLATTRPKTVLDVGTGTTAWPHLLRNCGFVVTAIDNVRDYWDYDMVNRHWTVLDVDITKPGDFDGQFDTVTCISVIEHIVDHDNAVRQMLRLLPSGGQLIITTPYNHYEHCPIVYKRADALYGADLPFIFRSHSSNEVRRWQNLGARLKRREMWRLFSGPVWATGSPVPWEQAQSEDAPHQLGCFEFEKV
jgi:2-polyprenyl-3-methyl-5-hydroxy-6-metoxy-1,4-benzoquinol methylase